MRRVPKVALLYFVFFMSLLIWVAFAAFSRKATGQTGIDMGKVQEVRNLTQGG